MSEASEVSVSEQIDILRVVLDGVPEWDLINWTTPPPADASRPIRRAGRKPAPPKELPPMPFSLEQLKAMFDEL